MRPFAARSSHAPTARPRRLPPRGEARSLYRFHGSRRSRLLSNPRAVRSLLLVLLVERLGISGLVIAELAAPLRCEQVERVGDVVVRVGHLARLALERRGVLVVLDIEDVDRIAL